MSETIQDLCRGQVGVEKGSREAKKRNQRAKKKGTEPDTCYEKLKTGPKKKAKVTIPGTN